MSSSTRTFGADALDRTGAYHLLNSIVVPRPIAWVSSINGDSQTNLAPHSYFTVAGVSPPTLLFVSVGQKDTIRNIQQTREFVINVADLPFAEQMNLSSTKAPYGVSEFDLAGVTPVPGELVAAPRVAEAPVSMECRLTDVVPVGDDPSYLVLGEVLLFHIAERVLDARGTADPDALAAIARMGGNVYCTTDERFEMARPSYDEVVAAGAGAESTGGT